MYEYQWVRCFPATRIDSETIATFADQGYRVVPGIVVVRGTGGYAINHVLMERECDGDQRT